MAMAGQETGCAQVTVEKRQPKDAHGFWKAHKFSLNKLVSQLEMLTPREKADVGVVSKEESEEDRADKRLR
jgi:hypothetical protein